MIPKYASTPFIILSSKNPQGLSEKAKEVGADLYLEKKPAALANIQEKILTLLPQRQKPLQAEIKILLVDDSSIIRHMMTNMLVGLGIQHVTHANNGLEALEILQEQTFDLIITDYHMPEMNGPELIKAIRARWSKNELPILMATGLEDSKIGQEFSTTDIQAKLTKPISVSDLRKTIVNIGLLR
jgi:two-component system chemotaxis response regulator CheY